MTLSCATSLPEPPARARVVLVSFDGVGFDDLQSVIASGALSSRGFVRLQQEGISSRVIPVNPTVTATAHAAILTGTHPEENGVVSNSIHLPGTPLNRSVSGFAIPIERDSVWQAARRSGLKVGSIAFPTIDGTTPERTADFSLNFTHEIVPSEIEILSQKDFHEEWYPEGWAPADLPGSYSAHRVARRVRKIAANATAAIEIVATDTTNDSRVNYDRFIVRQNKAEIPRDVNGWFRVTLPVVDRQETYLHGSWSKILSATRTLDVRLYWGAVYRNEGYPRSFRETIDREIGIWPGEADADFAADWLLGRGGIDPETYRQQFERNSAFLTNVTLWSIRNMPFDLLLSYNPTVDGAEHALRLIDPRQAVTNSEKRAAANAIRRAAYGTADAATAQLRDALPEDAALLVTSDHGMAATHTTVRMNRLLASWGFATVSGDRIAPDSRWAAFTSGASARLSAAARNAAPDREQLAERLRNLRTIDGEKVFERVELTNARHHSRSGQIVAYAQPGFSLSPAATGEIFSPATSFGQHGFLNHHRALHPILLAGGAGIPHRRLRAVDQTAIAAYVARLLRIEFAAGSR